MSSTSLSNSTGTCRAPDCVVVFAAEMVGMKPIPGLTLSYTNTREQREHLEKLPRLQQVENKERERGGGGGNKEVRRGVHMRDTDPRDLARVCDIFDNREK